MNVKIRNKFIEIKYNVSYGLVIFIRNYRWFRILEISKYRRTDLSLKLLGTSINSIPLFMKGIFMKCRLWFVSESTNGRRAC